MSEKSEQVADENFRIIDGVNVRNNMNDVWTETGLDMLDSDSVIRSYIEEPEYYTETTYINEIEFVYWGLTDLKERLERRDPLVSVGICYYAGYHPILDQIFRAWDKFSGDICHPVPSIVYNYSPAEMYLLAPKLDGLWNENTEYGRLRYELLDFCISYVQDVLTKLENLPK